jgi:hypothetical protein
MTTRVLLFLLLPLAVPSIVTAQTLPSHCVVLPLSQGPALIRQCSRSSPADVTGFWTPNISDVLKIEQRLPELLRKSGHRIDFAASRRQYIGFISHGKRLIYLNAFPAFEPHRDDPDWKSTPIMFCDGGDALWGVEFDPADKTFHNLGFNGEA